MKHSLHCLLLLLTTLAAHGAGVIGSQLPSTTSMAHSNLLFLVTDPGNTNTGTKSINVSNFLAGLAAMPHFPTITNVPTGRTLWVDAVNGNNTTGERGNLKKPFLTITAAAAAASAGDLINVGPGTYAENNIRGDLQYDFADGATLTYTDPNTGAGRGLWDDRGGIANLSVSGRGVFIHRCDFGLNPNTRGALVFTNPLSRVHFQAKQIQQVGYGGANTIAAIWSLRGTNFFDVDEIIDPERGVPFIREGEEDPVLSQVSGIYWENGELYVRNKKVSTSWYGAWSEEVSGTGVGTNNFWWEFDYVDSEAAGIYFSGDTGNYKTWLRGKEIASRISNGVLTLGSGKLYVDCMKIGSYFSSLGSQNSAIQISSGNAQVWVSAQKLFSKWHWIETDSDFTGTLHLDCQEYEDGGIVEGFRMQGGTANIYHGLATVASGRGLVHVGGTTRIQGLTIDTTAANTSITNIPVVVSAAGLTITDSTLLAPAIASNSVGAATSQTVTFNGVLVANKAIGSSVTKVTSGNYMAGLNLPNVTPSSLLYVDASGNVSPVTAGLGTFLNSGVLQITHGTTTQKVAIAKMGTTVQAQPTLNFITNASVEVRTTNNHDQSRIDIELIGAAGGGGGSGTVTSVGLNMPAGLQISGSPVTSAGTMAISLTTATNIIAGGGSGVGFIDCARASVFTNVLTVNTNYALSNMSDGQYVFIISTNTGSFTEGFSNIGAGQYVGGAAPTATTSGLNVWMAWKYGLRTNVALIGWVPSGSVTLPKLANVASDRLVGRDTAGSGAPEELTVTGGLEFTGSGGVQRSALTGDVTASAGSAATTIAVDAVSDTKLRNSGPTSVIGRSANSTGDPGDISSTADGQVLRRSGGTLGFGGVDLADSDAITGLLPRGNAASQVVYDDEANTLTGETTLAGPLTRTASAISGTDIDWAAGNVRTKTLTGNTTFTFSNLGNDRSLQVWLTQDGTGGRTVTWPVSIKWVNSTNQTDTPAVNSVAGMTTVYTFTRKAGTVEGFVTGPDSMVLADIANATGWAKGDILVYNGANLVRLPVGSNGEVLHAASGAATGLDWDTDDGVAAGDSVTVNSSAATDVNLLDGLDISWSLNTASTPDDATAAFARSSSGDLALSANHATFVSDGIAFEGSTANTIEGRLKAADPTSSDKVWTLPDATGTVVLQDSTDTLTGKTIDAAGSGNTIKLKGYITLTGFDNVTGAIPPNTNDVTLSTFMKPVFLNGTDQASNFIEWRIRVPPDIDTSADPRAALSFKLNGADTSTHRYVLSMASVAASAAYAGTPGTAINLDFAGDGSGANNDLEQIAFTTLTGWGAGVTANQVWVIRLARDGDAAQDGSTTESMFGEVTIEYGITQ